MASRSVNSVSDQLEIPVHIKDLIEEEQEAIHICKEAEPFLLKNGKTVSFSCLLLREQRMILLQYQEIKAIPKIEIEMIPSEERSNKIVKPV